MSAAKERPLWSPAVDDLQRLDHYLQGHKLGLITNPSGTTSDLTPTSEIFAARYQLKALFGPEHGVHGDAQAGVAVATGHNSRLNLPEYSLFGTNKRLQPTQLRGLDAMVFDIQDIGSRYYTYIYTMGLALADCGAAGIPFVVLDRPNPLGGTKAEGIVIRPQFRSFVGDYGLPARHPLTVGELAQRINRHYNLQADLTVIPCPAWDRSPWPSAASWTNPSPNMPSPTTALVYSGTCLFEATNISEGRGTTRPYELIGAPFVPHYAVAERLNGLKLPGVRFRAACFIPTFSKHQGQLCRGVQLHVTDPDTFNGFATGLHLFQTLRQLAPEMVITAPDHLNHLFGDDSLLNADTDTAALLQRAASESAAFLQDSRQDWLYPTKKVAPTL